LFETQLKPVQYSAGAVRCVVALHISHATASFPIGWLGCFLVLVILFWLFFYTNVHTFHSLYTFAHRRDTGQFAFGFYITLSHSLARLASLAQALSRTFKLFCAAKGCRLLSLRFA